MSILIELEIKIPFSLVNRYSHEPKQQMIRRKKQLHLRKIKIKTKQQNLKILLANVIIPGQLPISKYLLKFFEIFILYTYCLLQFCRENGTEVKDLDLWLAFAAFHAGDYQRASDVSILHVT